LLDTIVKQGAVDIWNGLIDQSGAIHKRPGLVLHQTPGISTGMKGIFWWEAKRRWVLVGDGNTYATDNLIVGFVKQNDDGNKLAGGYSQFADTGEWLYICSETGQLLAWDGNLAPTLDPDAAAPTDVCSIAFFKGRVYAVLRDTNRIWYTTAVASTDPGLRLTWEGYIDVRRSGDPVIAIQDMGPELIVFKKGSVESYYYDDSIESIRPVEGSMQEYGLQSPRGFNLFTGQLYFFCSDRGIYQIRNRQIVPVSQQFNSFLRTIPHADDARMFRVDHYLFLTFPTSDLTVVFDLDLGAWYRWSSFVRGTDREFIATCAATQPGDANLFVLGASDSQTYFLDYNQFTDNGEPIHFLFRSNHYDHGTSNRKMAVRLVAKVALDSPRLNTRGIGGIPVPPAPELPEATRCTAYSYTFSAVEGYTVGVTGLPAGLTWNAVTRTISGMVPCVAGTFPVGVYMIDSRGAHYRYTRNLIVNDFDPEITFV
jgi:hypothetical protein